MIETMSFVNVNGAYIDFNDDALPLTNFTNTVDMRMTERERIQQHGLYPSNTYLGKRIIGCSGDILEQDSASYWKKRLDLTAAVTPRPQTNYKIGDLTMWLSGMSEELTCECTLDGWPEIPLVGASPSRSTYMVNFKAFDPRLYGALQSVALEYDVPINAGGRTYNKTFDKTYPGVLSSGPTVRSQYIRNSGNIETFPVVVFHGPVTDPRLFIERDNGETFVFSLTDVTLNDYYEYVTVDFLKRTVVAQDGTNLYNHAIGSDWWWIEPDPVGNLVTYIGFDAATPASAVIQWRNAYMI